MSRFDRFQNVHDKWGIFVSGWCSVIDWLFGERDGAMTEALFEIKYSRKRVTFNLGKGKMF